MVLNLNVSIGIRVYWWLPTLVLYSPLSFSISLALRISYFRRGASIASAPYLHSQ